MNRCLRTNNSTEFDADLLMIFSVRLLHVDHYQFGDIIEKCLLSILTRVLLLVGETRLGKGRLPATIYVR